MAHDSSSSEAQVRATLDDFLTAFRAKDAARVVSFYASEPVLFELAPPLQTAIREKGIADWFASWDGPVGYELRDLKITADESLAYCHGLGHMSGKRTDGTKVDLWTRVTRCLRRVDGRWKVVHEHESVPFYMDGSNKAALDLKP